MAPVRPLTTAQIEAYALQSMDEQASQKDRQEAAYWDAYGHDFGLADRPYNKAMAILKYKQAANHRNGFNNGSAKACYRLLVKVRYQIPKGNAWPATHFRHGEEFNGFFGLFYEDVKKMKRVLRSNKLSSEARSGDVKSMICLSQAYANTDGFFLSNLTIHGA